MEQLRHNAVRVNASLGRSALTLNTWRPFFASVYSVSLAGHSAAESAELLYQGAHVWLERLVARANPDRATRLERAPFGQSFQPSDINDDFRQVHAASFRCANEVATTNLPQRAWHLGFKCRDQSNDGRLWRVGIGCRTASTSAGNEVVLSVDSAFKEAIAGLPNPDLTVPFIGYLRQSFGQQISIRSGKTELPGAPRWISQSEQVPDLFLALHDETREHPLVLVSAYWNPDGTLAYGVSPDELARTLAGLAPVYVEGPVAYGQSTGLRDILEHELGVDGELLAWGGAIRVYQPGDCNSHLPHNQPYWRRHGDISESQVVSEIKERCFQLAHKELRGHKLSPLTSPQEIELFATQDKLTQLQSVQLAGPNETLSAAEAAEWRSLAEQYASENDRLREALREASAAGDAARAEADQLRQERNELLVINVDLQREISELSRKVADATPRIDPEKLASGKEVYDAVMASCSDRISFTARGAATLQEFTLRKKALYPMLYTAFMDLHSRLWPLQYPERHPNFLTEFNSSTQFSLVMTEGPHTKERADLARLRQDMFEGQSIEAWPHLRFGTRPGEQFRLHFSFLGEGANGRIVVSWVGDHLPVASSSKTGKRRG
jgi:hypothetical protein